MDDNLFEDYLDRESSQDLVCEYYGVMRPTHSELSRSQLFSLGSDLERKFDDDEAVTDTPPNLYGHYKDRKRFE